MSDNTRYDKATQTLWVACQNDADTLVANTELKQWVDALKAGTTTDGQALSAVNYVFTNAESAEYNQQPLSFSKIGTYVGSLKNPRSFGDVPSFNTKEDFGV